MKRLDLVRHLEANGCELLRVGSRHSVYVNRRARKGIVGPETSRDQRAPRAEDLPGSRGVGLGAERYRVQFTADRELYEQLQELRALMRHQVPDGDLSKILARAVKTLLERVRKQKFAETSAPRPARAPTSSNKTPSRHSRDLPRRLATRRGPLHLRFERRPAL